MKFVFMVVVVACLVTGLEPAVAEPAPRVAATAFTGPGAKAFRLRVIRALSTVQWVPIAEVEATARSLGVSLGDITGRTAVARTLRLSAFVHGSSVRKRRRWHADVRIRLSVGDKVLRASGSSRKRSRAFRMAALRLRRSRGDLAAASPPKPIAAIKTARPQAKVQPRPQSVTAKARAVKPRKKLPAARLASVEQSRVSRLHFGASAVAMSRTLSYTDDIKDGLRSFTLPGGPAAQLWGKWYPFGNLGVEGRVQRSFGLDAARADGTRFATESMEYVVQSRVRASLGAVELGLSAGYGAHSFSIDGAPEMTAGVPNTDYTFARGGMDAGVRATDNLRLTIAGAYRHLLGTGDLESSSWFPRLDGAGVDGLVGLAYRISGNIEVNAAASVRRYFFSMNPEPGDPHIAGGAVDQLVSISIGLAWRLEKLR